MIMIINFADYFGIIRVLTCFDQCLGLKLDLLVTRLIKLFHCCSNSCGCSLLSLYPATIVNLFKRFGLYCKIVSNRS